MAGESSNPGTVEEIFKDFSGRRSSILQALSVGRQTHNLSHSVSYCLVDTSFGDLFK